MYLSICVCSSTRTQVGCWNLLKPQSTLSRQPIGLLKPIIRSLVTNQFSVTVFSQKPVLNYQKGTKQKLHYSTLPQNKPPIKPESDNDKYTKKTIVEEIQALKSSYFRDMHDLTNDILSELEKKKYNRNKIMFIGALIIIAVILALYDLITSMVSKQVNVISAKSLDDPELKEKLKELGKNLVFDLVHDKEIQDDVVHLLAIAVKDLCRDEKIQDDVVELLKVAVIKLCHNPVIQEDVKDLLGKAVKELVEEDDIQDKLKELVKIEIMKLSEDPKIQGDIGDLIYEAIKTIVVGKN